MIDFRLYVNAGITERDARSEGDTYRVVLDAKAVWVGLAVSGWRVTFHCFTFLYVYAGIENASSVTQCNVAKRLIASSSCMVHDVLLYTILHFMEMPHGELAFFHCYQVGATQSDRHYPSLSMMSAFFYYIWQFPMATLLQIGPTHSQT